MNKIVIKSFDSTLKKKKNLNSIENPRFPNSKDNNQKIYNSKHKTKKTIMNNMPFTNLINFVLLRYILFILPKVTFLFTLPENYILLEIDKIGYQQIISDKYDINKSYPYRIYIGNKLQIMKNKKLKLEQQNNAVKIIWNDTYPNLTYMFADLINIKSITLNNMLNVSSNNLSNMFNNCKDLESFKLTGEKTNYEIVSKKLFYIH